MFVQLFSGKKSCIPAILFSAVLLSAAWSISGLWFLLFGSFIPLLALIFNQRREVGIAIVYLSLFLWIVAVHFEMIMADFEGRTSAILIGLVVIPAIWSLPFALVQYTARKYSIEAALLSFPFVYTSLEVLQNYWSLPFTWINLGNAFSTSELMHGSFAYLGVEGMTWVIVASNSLAYLALMRWHDNKKLALGIFGVSILILAVMVVFNQVGESHRALDGNRVKVAVFEPELSEREALKDNVVAQVELLEEAMSSEFTGADLLICPEDYLKEQTNEPLFTNNLSNHQAMQLLGELSRKHQVAILSGASLVELFKTTEAPTLSAKRQSAQFYFDVYNGSVFVTPDGTVSWRSKQLLVPIVEEIPFYKSLNYVLGILGSEVRLDETYAIAKFDGPYEYKNLKIAPLICFEALSCKVVAQYVVQGANMLALLTTKWTNSSTDLQRQKSYMNATASSFGKPWIDANFKITDQPDGGSFRYETVILNDETTLYGQFAQAGYLWFFVTFIILWSSRKIKPRNA